MQACLERDFLGQRNLNRNNVDVGKVVAALRNEFGGHEVVRNGKK